ncbi:MAG: EAL domain-containing protein, partial [Pseudomonadota bacterium]
AEGSDYDYDEHTLEVGYGVTLPLEVRADAFVALPGGAGTLDETIEIIPWRQLGLHGKPVVIVDDGGRMAGILGCHDVLKVLQGKFSEYLKDVIGDETDASRNTGKRISEKVVLDNILRSSTDLAIIVTDIDFRIVDFNSVAERLFGCSGARALGQMVSSIWPGGDVEKARFNRAVDELRKHGKNECVMQWEAGGSVHYVDMRMSSMLNDAGTVVGYVLMAKDITERRESRIKLGILRALMDNTNDSIFVIQPESGRLIDVNEHACTSLGYSRDELLNMHVWEIARAVTESVGWRDMLGRHRMYDNLRLETSQLTRTGKQIPVEINSRLIEMDDKKYIVAIARDIAQRHSPQKQLRKRDAIMDAIAFSASLLLKTHNWVQDIPRVLERLGRAIGASRVYVFQNDKGEKGDLITHQRYEWSAPGITPRVGNTELQNCSYTGTSLERWAVLMGQRLAVSGSLRDFPPEEAAFLQARQVKSLLAVPIFVEQAWWGFIGFDDCVNERDWFGPEADALMAAADVMASAIARQRSERQLQHSATVFENTAEGVMITDAGGNILDVNNSFTVITGYGKAEVLGKNPRMLRSGRHAEEFYRDMWSILLKAGQWEGEIWNRRKNGEVYPEWLNISVVRGKDGSITNFVGVFSDISHAKRSQLELNFLAHHDPLTGLPNRLLFTERLGHALKRAQRENRHVALLFIDLDRFKNINDTLGHPVGDILLSQVAQTMQQAIREEDTLARLGGDEFTVILEDVGHSQNAAAVAQKLMECFSLPYSIQGRELYLTASIGISLFPQDGDEVDTLLKNADVAMYQAKAQGRNAYHFFTQSLSVSALERFSLENDLRQALHREEFSVYYQPQFSLHTGRIIGAEALIRWPHPDKGMISPARFIPVAEDSGLIIPIGEWVLRTVCMQMQGWRETGGELERVSVNVSGMQVQRGHIVDSVNRVLDETGLAPHLLELEITEGFIMHQTDGAIETLEALRALGVALSIDDFGTGYSSLTYLKRLPVSKLKIDQSFIQGIPEDPNDEAIVKAVIALGKSMQFQLVAEGIENDLQHWFLKHQQCDFGQGYHYCRPLPSEAFADLLKKSAARID